MMTSSGSVSEWCDADVATFDNRRPATVVPIIGARRLDHLESNLAGLQVILSPEHLRRLDEVSAPTLGYPAPMHGALRAMLQFAGTTVDGEASTV